MNRLKMNLQLLPILYTILIAVFLVSAACDNDEITSAENDDTTPGNVIEITAIHDHAENLHLFEMSDQEVSSGWNTFEFTNASPVDHFFVIFRVPDEGIEAAEAAGDALLDHWFQGVTVPFQHEYTPYHNGDIDFGEFVDNLVGEILEKSPWYLDPGAIPFGGPGFTAAGKTSVNTLYLEPGEYVVECYVKDKEGLFHSYVGMLEHLHVTEETSETSEPIFDSSVVISTESGIQYENNFLAGDQVIKIHFEDQDAYGHLLGHNVQLVKFDEEPAQGLLNDLALWMNWANPEGLVAQSPNGAEFIGGTMEMAAGATTYFHATLEPGHYAWIAEVPDPSGKDMLKTFIVGN